MSSEVVQGVAMVENRGELRTTLLDVLRLTRAMIQTANGFAVEGSRHVSVGENEEGGGNEVVNTLFVLGRDLRVKAHTISTIHDCNHPGESRFEFFANGSSNTESVENVVDDDEPI
eukprot:TRINITY_DN5743_c0_g1_i1.p1 TRINITY_DN5743_c0_g1~~TRINITY_DN5743_c0_g1_i1.p1  ORF type:complete len:116 (-),score=23.85 TRINITY_DN5743_c0_g1_i1:38-385(-)